EIRALESGTVDRIYSPEDGRKLGLQGIIDDLLARSDFDPVERAPASLLDLVTHDAGPIARAITRAEQSVAGADPFTAAERDLLARAARLPRPVVGITGTGGAGKSSLTDELLRRYLLDNP